MKQLRLLPASKIHGLLDYCTILFLFLAPALFEFHPLQAKAIYLLAILQLLLTVCTQYPYGLLKWISFEWHGKLELAIVILLLVGSFMFFNQEKLGGAYFFVVLALIYCVLYFTTDFSDKRQLSIK